MARKIRVSELPEFDMAEHLDSDEAIAEYLNQVIEEDDPAELAHALSVIARARDNLNRPGERHDTGGTAQSPSFRCPAAL